MQLMIDAVCSVAQVDATYAVVPILVGEPATRFFKAGRGEVGEVSLEWEPFAKACEAMGATTKSGRLLSPRGELSTLRLQMGVGAQAQVWFASRREGFLSPGQMTFLRAAVSLAALGLANARSDHERDLAHRAKDEFLAMLGHELRNPLAPIVTTLGLIRIKGSGHLAREHEVIERQVGHLSRLVDDLLDITRITRDRVELRRETVEMGAAIGDAVEGVSSLLEERQHEIVVDTCALAWVDGDPARIRQILSNLLLNAAKYTAPNGRIVVSSRLVGTSVEVRIADNGMGIDAKLLPKVFGLFEQGSMTIDRARGGLGIGLAIVKKLVELHDGSVSAASEGPGKGSCFTVTLPLAQAQGASVAPSSLSKATAQRRGTRVLLVDDNVDALDTMAAILGFSGFDVETARDPAEAMRKAPSFAPDAYVLDIGLPGLDGYQLAAELRRIGGARAEAAVFVALTGYGQATDKARAEQAGFHHHLVKPVQLENLLAALPTHT